jgi:hypothetical protein
MNGFCEQKMHSIGARFRTLCRAARKARHGRANQSLSDAAASPKAGA